MDYDALQFGRSPRRRSRCRQRCRAQFIYFDTNGDGVSDYDDSVYAPTDTLYVWLDTTHDPYGGVASCPTGEAMTFGGYELVLNGSMRHGGTVLYGTWVNRIPQFNLGSTSAQEGQAIGVSYLAQTGPATLPPGRYLLGEIPIQSTGYICDHQMGLLLAHQFGQEPFETKFASLCPGVMGDNYIRLGADFFAFEPGGVVVLAAWRPRRGERSSSSIGDRASQAWRRWVASTLATF